MLPASLRTIAQGAFYKCESLKTVKFNDGLEVLENDCFSYSDIRHLVLPASVRSIGPKAFYECRCLESVDLRAAHNLKELAEETFEQCEKLRQVLLNDGLETIGPRCFVDSALEEVVVPNSVRRVGDGAFDRNSYLERVRFLGPAESAGQCAARSDCEQPPR